MKPLLAALAAAVIAACGSGGGGDVQPVRTECRTDANGRLICTTYEPVKKATLP